MLGSITVDAAGYDAPYIIYLHNSTIDVVYISTNPIHAYSKDRNDTTVPFYVGAQGNLIELCYNTALEQWQTKEINEIRLNATTLYVAGTTTAVNGDVYVNSGSSFSTQSVEVYTNVAWNSTEKKIASVYSNDLTQLPQGITEEAIREIIDQQLNTSTQSGQTAQTIINNTTNQYNLYLSGDIDSSTMQQNVSSNIDTLSGLTPSTLLDAMQINNAITYNQTIQDELHNTISSDVQSVLSQNIDSAYDWYGWYTEQPDRYTQEDTINKLNIFERNIADLIVNGTATTTADINAVNAAINTINTIKSGITDRSDLSLGSSDKSQASDQAELDYLDELNAETTATVEQLAPSKNFTSTQTGEAQQVLELIWENEFVKRLLPMCAGFMVVCVVLGVKYKV